MYISDNQELSRFCAMAQNASMVAVDTEFLREFSYIPKLCLVQLCVGTKIAVVDVLQLGDLKPLHDLMKNPAVLKVFHSPSQDLECFQQNFDYVPAPIFDTQIAAAYLGLSYQMGLSGLIKYFLDLNLRKSESLSNWAKRPLTAQQLRYAEDDVRWLLDIYTKECELLKAAGRMSWLDAEFAQQLTAAKKQNRPEDAYIHLRHVNSLTRSQLAIARELAAWRERRARALDLPKRKVMSDTVLVELVRVSPQKEADLNKIRGLASFSKADAEAIISAVQEGKNCKAELYPESLRHVSISPKLQPVLDLMSALVRLIAAREKIAPEVLANKADLKDLLAEKPDAALKHGWKHELVGAELEKLLKGEVGLTVKDQKIELL